VAATETEEGKRLAESLIKQLSGGEPIKARFLHQNNFTFKPEFKLFFVSNHKPVIRGTDKGIWRRIRLVPFTVTIPDDEVDRKLPDKLKKELPGILRWMVEGCLKWQKEGLGIPEDVESATSDYQEEMDSMSHFIEEYCVINLQAQVNAKSLYPIYTAWCEETGEYAVTKIKLMMKLREWMDSRGHSFDEVKTKSFRGWAGLGLRSAYPGLSDEGDTGDTEKAIINNHSNVNNNINTSVTFVTESTAAKKEVAIHTNAWEEGEL
jgi:phage/plasmid-associated DNA primase